ncbi:MAG: alpha/beta hydrolase [Patescibacteria group bacterium]
MNNIFIIHGAYGNPTENWFPWLKIELEKLNCRVFVPRFPTPDNQNLDSWQNVFKEYKQYINKDTIFVGHSIGPAFLLNILESRDEPIKACFFVAGFISMFNNPDFDNINKTFIDTNFDWHRIKQNCGKFFILHSDNDPYVPLAKAKELGKQLDTDVEIIKNAGHFNEKAGYDRFDLLLEKIKQEL